MSKNLVLVVGTILALILVGYLGIQAFGASSDVAVAQAQSAPADQSALPRTITVVGRGVVSVKPDIATISIGVQVQSPTVKEATSQAAAQMEKVLAALTAQGVAEKDIQTNNYSISYESRGALGASSTTKVQGAAEPAGVYNVSNMVQVKVRDLTKVSAIVDEAINAGANNLWGINFTLEDTNQAEMEARAKAVADAKSRAEEFAKLAGVKVGPVLQVSEVIGGNAILGAYAADSVRMGGWGGLGPVSPGELEIQFQVQAIYAME